MANLNLKDAFYLFRKMKPYLPDIVENLSPIDFIQEIVENCIHADKHLDYLQIVSSVSGISVPVLLEGTPEEILEICLQGFIDNHISELVQFCRLMGM